MDEPKPKKPWWKKTRWRALLALWLAFGYPLSMGPACYFCERGWLTTPFFQAVYRPLLGMGSDPQDWTRAGRSFGRYCGWWSEVGYRHAASAEAESGAATP